MGRRNFLVKQFFTNVIAYGSVSLVPLCLVSHCLGSRGTISIWGAIVVGTACSFWASYGFSWPSGVLINYIVGDIAGLVIGLPTAQFFQMHRQIITARLAAQGQALEVTQQQQISELKDLLLMNLSHELRTPLTEVYGYLELLRDFRQHLSIQRGCYSGGRVNKVWLKMCRTGDISCSTTRFTFQGCPPGIPGETLRSTYPIYLRCGISKRPSEDVRVAKCRWAVLLG